jgi:hypothetical protein
MDVSGSRLITERYRPLCPGNGHSHSISTSIINEMIFRDRCCLHTWVITTKRVASPLSWMSLNLVWFRRIKGKRKSFRKKPNGPRTTGTGFHFQGRRPRNPNQTVLCPPPFTKYTGIEYYKTTMQKKPILKILKTRAKVVAGNTSALKETQYIFKS